MNDNKKRILEMLAAGKISVDEAARLMTAVEGAPFVSAVSSGEAAARPTPRYLRVLVDGLNQDKHDGDRHPEKVNIRVPVALIRAGIKLTSLIPREAAEQVDKALAEKGVNVNLKNLKEEDLTELLDALTDLVIEVDDGKSHVRVRAEY
ncbi:MAG: hypothetical protein FWF18_03890 [Dehalococcoidia bacterium]|nr:hypothetical protein [Dehalococcoidia bacterium]